MKHITLLALATVAAVGWTETSTPINRIQFTSKPGYMEFSGRMLARPIQQKTWLRLGANVLEAQTNRAAAETMLQDMRIDKIDQIDVTLIRVPQGMNENTLARQLMGTGLFEYVEPDYIVYPQFTPNDPMLASQWSQSNNQATEAWDISRGSAGIRLTVTDTGIHGTHQDITGRRILGANSATATNTSNVLTEAVNGYAVVKDLHGHGTHCTGIAAANTNNGVGITGINIENTTHQMVRVSNSSGGGSSITALTVAMLWAAENGADVVSTSYSGVQNSTIGTTGTTMKNTHNALSFWAAGNDGGTYNGSDWADVTIVGALTSANSAAGFSARGGFIDVFAPGAGILSTVWVSDTNNSSYATWDGTSMACPYAAGLASLIWSMNPGYTAQRVQDILYRSAITMGAPGSWGWGRVNAWNAVGRKANNFSLFRGILVSGALADLFRVEGNTLTVGKGITVNASEPPIQVVTEHNVAANVSGNISEIAVQVQSNVNTAGSLARKVQLFDFTTGQYVDVASGAVGQTSSFFEARQTTTPANFISGGIVRVRTQVYPTGPVANANWRASFDQINVRCLRATE